MNIEYISLCFKGMINIMDIEIDIIEENIVMIGGSYMRNFLNKNTKMLRRLGVEIINLCTSN